MLLGIDAATLDQVQSRLAAVAALPEDDASPLVTTAQTAADRVAAILHQADGIAVDGFDLGEGIVAADEAVARAEVAKQRALDRLARSRGLRDQVAAGSTGEAPDETGRRISAKASRRFDRMPLTPSRHPTLVRASR